MRAPDRLDPHPEFGLLTFLLTVASVFAAVIPMVGFLALLWWLDRYDREPVWLVALTFAWGALLATTLSLIGNTTLDLTLHAALGADWARRLTPVVVAPLIEEPAKAAVLLLVVRSRSFDNITDGFVYGAAAGLGFGMTENLLYFVTAAKAASYAPLEGTLAWLTTVGARTFFSALMHASASALVGAALGWVRLRRRWLQMPALALGLGGAMSMHALWNGLLTVASEQDMPQLIAVDFALFPVQLALIFGGFQVCLLVERRALAVELEAEARDHETFPADHVRHLSSYHRRSFARFTPKTIDQKAYIRVATTLGFRRAQARQATGRDQSFYLRDLERTRREIRGLLAPATDAETTESSARRAATPAQS